MDWKKPDMKVAQALARHLLLPGLPAIRDGPDEYLAALRKRGTAYAKAFDEIQARHGIETPTILLLIEAVGTPTAALELLDRNLPIEYVLAMGETR